MHFDAAHSLVGTLALLGTGFFLYNMYLAGQGWRDMRKIKKQMAASAQQKTAMEALNDRHSALREELKARYGADYALMAEPIDLLAAHSISALLAGDYESAKELLEEACHEMEVLLRGQTV